MSLAAAAGGRRRGEAGDTLIEVLVALVIMGLAFVVIVGGVGTAIIGAGVQQNRTTADSVLRSSADTVTGDTYKACAGAADYPLPAPPAGFTVTIASVAYWDPSSNKFDSTSCAATPPTDSGLQVVTVTATSTNVHAPQTATLQVVKRQP